MRKKTLLHILSVGLFFGLVSCNDHWNEYYNEKELSSDGSIEVYKGNLKSYLASESNLSRISDLLKNTGMMDNISAEQTYTVIVYPNDKMQDISLNDTAYARYCISDICISPSKLSNELGLRTRLGKNIWVYQRNGAFYLDQYPITKVVKTKNAYVYHIEESTIPVRPSIYEVLNGLGNEYSEFKRLVRRYEEVYFDKENSTPNGSNDMGNTIYKDSVWAVKNKLMDRFTADGIPYWDMRSENYLSTMFIPSNSVIKSAIDTAMSKIPLYLGRDTTTADRKKFEEWLLRACFINQRLTSEEVSGGLDVDCVDGYIRDSLSEKKFRTIERAMWRPTVQRVEATNPTHASNGACYKVNYLKVPNYVIIYRVKSKFYELWNAMNKTDRDKYFRWINWEEPLVINDAQGSFELSATLPIMYYNVLTAIPTKTASRDSLACSVTYDGLLYNPTTRKVSEVRLPAGEYYLRMGFKHSLTYSLSIQFNDQLLIKDMVMYAQGSNYHFDRGSVGVVDYEGEMSIGYPEGYNWKDWAALNEKAQAYDTDGYQVAIVNIPKEGNFTITISSYDNSYLFNRTINRDKNNVSMLMMYHWCLRPTKNNY